MNILHLSKFYPPDHSGGIESVCRDLCEGMASKVNNITVLAHTFKRKLSQVKSHNVNIIYAPINFSFSSLHFSLSYIIQYYLIRKKFDIIHLHLPNPLALFVLIIFPVNSKLVIHWHSDIVRQKILHYFIKPLEIIIVKKSNIVLAPTSNHINYSYMYRYFHNKHKIIPFPINFSYLNDRIMFPKILKGFSYKSFIFTLGRHVSYKGFETLIHASLKIHEDISIFIGGKGPLTTRYMALIKQLGLTDKVILLGYLSNSEINYLYKNCMCFCLPSITKAEMYGVVQLEAMYHGKAVISTNIVGSGVPLVNIHNYTGIIIDPNCPVSLSSSINLLYNDKELLFNYSENAYNFIRSNYNYSNLLKKHLSVYNEI